MLFRSLSQEVLDLLQHRLLQQLQDGLDAKATQDAEVELGEEDVEVSYYRDDAIDLAGLMREQFYLALPMKPLCTDDCKGLCPQCGTNRNVSQCSCTQGWVDPRLAALQALKTGES